jgi:hypothetical protein
MDRGLIDFVDSPNLDQVHNPFLALLKRRYELVLSDWPDFILITHEGQRTCPDGRLRNSPMLWLPARCPSFEGTSP